MLNPQNTDKDEVSYGGMMRVPGLYPKSSDEMDKIWHDFEESIKRGLAILAEGSPTIPQDCGVVPGAQVEMFDYFDVDSGEHVLAWRIACRQVTKH